MLSIFQHWDLILVCYFWQFIFNTPRLLGSLSLSCIFKINTFSIRLKSGPVWSLAEPSWVILAVCLRFLSSWNIPLPFPLDKFLWLIKLNSLLICPGTSLHSCVLWCHVIPPTSMLQSGLGIIHAMLFSLNTSGIIFVWLYSCKWQQKDTMCKIGAMCKNQFAMCWGLQTVGKVLRSK